MNIRGISPTSRLTERKLARHHARLVEACVEVSGGGPTEEGRSRGGERKREENRGGEVRVQSVADFRDTSRARYVMKVKDSVHCSEEEEEGGGWGRAKLRS